MASQDFREASTITTTAQDYSVSHKTIDEPSKTDETVYDNPNWSKYLGYYKQIPEFKEAIRALARWSVGRGYEAGPEEQVILDHLIGAGEDSFQSIMTNHIIVKKTNGDAYAEIIKDDKTGLLINLKPLNPGTMRTVFNKKGLILRYEEFDPNSKGKEPVRKFKPEEIFHSMNDRVANETHGVSVLEACQWVIDARNEAMKDWRRISHLSTIRVIYVDSSDTTQLTKIKTEYADAIKNGSVMVMPGKNGEVEILDYNLPPINSFLEWIRYLEGFFYQAVGVPRAIANTENFSEASSKVGYLTFEPVYVEEQTLLEQDIWNQLNIRVRFNRPASLSGVMQESEEKNTGQMGFQPSEMTATAGRVE
jgi:hypothetical protein